MFILICDLRYVVEFANGARSSNCGPSEIRQHCDVAVVRSPLQMQLLSRVCSRHSELGLGPFRLNQFKVEHVLIRCQHLS